MAESLVDSVENIELDGDKKVPLFYLGVKAWNYLT